MVNKIFDTIIIGAGPAGMTAAIYLGRANKSVCVIDKDGFGGNMAKSPRIENYPGFDSISGIDLAKNMYNQLITFDTINHIVGKVVLLRYNNRLIEVYTNDNVKILGKTLIIAVGTEHKKLMLNTKDIYYYVACNGPLFKNKNVIVVGSDDIAATYALELSNYCKKVYLCDATFDIRCEEITKKKILSNKKINWLQNCSIKETKNNKDGNLTAVILNTLDELKVSAIFVAIGMEPSTDFLNQFVERDRVGYINPAIQKVPGVFVAGDCINKKIRQITTAVNDGAIAAANVIDFLEDLK